MKILVVLLGGLLISAASLVGYAIWPRSALSPDAKADRILVLKSERRMLVYQGGAVLREYRIALGFSPTGAKEREGDGKTPEGRYLIDYRNPKSGYHLSLHVSYPTADQEEQARAKGLSPGGMIMIHGLRNGSARWLGRWHRVRDWTAGCIAVTNEEMDELWRIVPDGIPIEIRS